ncbi:MAG: hypothetical protein KAW46_02475 [candidate division Zixibacteria bacterium]|nr:hypothetical protein [candidate division Zixibacteria bacterium]
MRIILQTAVVGLLLIMGGCGDDNPVNNNGGGTNRVWERTFGGTGCDQGYSVAVTGDHGYVVTGSTRSFGGNGPDVYLIRTNAAGDTLWTKAHDGGSDDIGYSVAVTSDGGFIIAGETNSIGAGGTDAYLIKTDALGDTIWTRAYGGTDDDLAYSVAPTDDGGYIIVGKTASYGAGAADVYLIKINAFGDTAWTRTYGGLQDDYGESVALAGDGGYVVAGHTNSFGAGDIDVYVIKTDAAGDTVWTRTYGGGSWDYGHAIAATTDSGFVIVGRTESFGNGPDVYVVKIDAAGDTLWTRTYGGTSIDRGYAVAPTNDGGCCVAGFTMSTPTGFADAYIIKINASGTTVWIRTVGGDLGETAQSVAPTSDGGCIVAGYTYSFGAGLSDVYLIKLDAGGNLPIE